MATASRRQAIVKSVTDITPHMRRIAFGGPDLIDFPQGTEGGYIKLMFPGAPSANPDRPVMRTYSVRSHNADAGEIDVDFAVHGDTGGVAIDWASKAKPGDIVPFGGPGIVKMVPPDAGWYLIAADMTGLPAAMCNLELLPATAKGYAVLEVTSDADKQDLNVPEGFEVQWVIDSAPQELNGTLLKAVKALPWRNGDPFIWTACEFDTMRALRGYYRTDRGVDKRRIYLSSYWRAGRTEDQHKIDKRKDAEAG